MAQEIIKSSEIGVAIRSRRKELGWSQDELAEKIGVTLHQLQRYESGRTILNVENVQRIANVLSLPMSAFFEVDSFGTVAETPSPYFSADEKTLLRVFRSLSAPADRKLVISVIKRIARK